MGYGAHEAGVGAGGAGEEAGGRVVDEGELGVLRAGDASYQRVLEEAEAADATALSLAALLARTLSTPLLTQIARSRT